MKKVISIGLVLMAALMLSHPLIRAQRKQDQSRASALTKKAAAKPEGAFGNVEAISAAQIKDYLYFVASDEMEGRETPSRGLDLTAKFLALNLSRWGLKPMGSDGSFFQKIELRSRQVLPEGTSATIDGQSYKVGEDFIALLNGGQASGNLVYVGHGLMIKAKNIDAYRGLDVKDKILLVAEAQPKGVTFQDFRGKVGVDFDTPDTYAQAHGAKGIVRIPSSSTLNFWDQRYRSTLNPSRPLPDNQRMGGVPTITASEKMIATILQGEQINYETIKKQMTEGVFAEPLPLSPGKQVSFTVNAKVTSITTQNVVALLEGSDPVLKNEYVAVGAHYDHVGIGQPDDKGDKIYNGADDDGSGTVAVLAIAEALAQGPRPKRSVLLVWHAGEEKGLWGSEFVTDNPVVPLNQIITQLNIDMIGRSKKNGDNNPRNANLTGPDEIYVIGSKMMSTELGELSESVNQSFLNLKFNYKYDDPNDRERLFYRSDHYNYARKGIPIIFYFDGIHEDYHRPSDHPDKIDYQKMEKVTRMIFATMWKLANTSNRPKVDKQLPSVFTAN